MFCSSDVSVQTINLPPKIKLSGYYLLGVYVYYLRVTVFVIIITISVGRKEMFSKKLINIFNLYILCISTIYIYTCNYKINKYIILNT